MRQFSIVMICIFIILFNGCDTAFFSTSILAIHNNPRKYSGETVKVEGNVIQTMNLILIKYFILRDETGEIFIVTDRILPREGSTVSVKGRVEEAFNIGNEQMIVIIEEK